MRPPASPASRPSRAVVRGVLLLALATVAACDRHQADAAPPAAALPGGEVLLPADQRAAITVQLVGTRDERVVATLPAQVVADEDHTVHVLPPVAGRVLSLDAAPGEHVAAGQPLAHIASGDAAQARSDLVKAQAVLAQATAALRRAEDLYAHHVVAEKDVEQARTEAAQARAETDRATARVRQLGGGAGVSDVYVLRAPLAGEVIERAVNPGAEVRPDAGTALFTITSLDTLWLTATVYQRDLPQLRQGARLVFETDAAPGRAFVARVAWIAGALDPQTRTATVRATLANPDHALRTLETGQARLYAAERAPVLVIPTRALVTHGTDTVVYVELAPGRYARRVVTVGDDDGTSAAILSGLAPGERVVVDGSLLLEGESRNAA